MRIAMCLFAIIFICSCQNDGRQISNSAAKTKEDKVNTIIKSDSTYYVFIFCKGETRHLKKDSSDQSFIIVSSDRFSLFENCERVFEDTFVPNSLGYNRFRKNRNGGFGMTITGDTLIYDEHMYEGISRYYRRSDTKIICD